MEKLTKRVIEKLMALEGEARGLHLTNDCQFILRTKGENGLQRLEKRLKELECPIEYKKISSLAFYPIGIRAVSLLVMQEVFEWKDENIRKACAFGTSASLIVKLYMKFFYSISKLVDKVPNIWQEYFNKGELEISEWNLKEKRAIIQLRDFSLHPIYCCCLEGYFAQFIKMLIKTSSVKCKEIKCMGNYHEFLLEWE